MSVEVLHKCQEESCDQEGTACFYPDNESETPDEYYCTSHAFKHGFCYLCGDFWAGVGSFDFAQYYGGIQGLCENCSFTVRDECGEFDEDDEDYYDFDLP